MDGDLRITVIAPDARWLHKWYAGWRTANEKRGIPGTDIVEQMKIPLEHAAEALAETFSSPRIELLRAPPGAPGVDGPRTADLSPANLASIVTLFEYAGRRILLTGDGRSDHIGAGLGRAGLLSEQPLRLDVLQLPHWGSERNMSPGFLRAVTADHYVVVVPERYRSLHERTAQMIADARGDAPHAIHLVDAQASPCVIDLLKPRRRRRARA